MWDYVSAARGTGSTGVKIVVSFLTWVLGTELGSSERVTRTPNP